MKLGYLLKVTLTMRYSLSYIISIQDEILFVEKTMRHQENILVPPTLMDIECFRFPCCNWQSGISRLSIAARCTSNFWEPLEAEPWWFKDLRSRGIGLASVAGSRTSEIKHFPNYINVSHMSLRNNNLYKIIYNTFWHLTKNLIQSWYLSFKRKAFWTHGHLIYSVFI